MRPRTTDAAFWTGAAVLFAVVGVALSLDTLNYPWTYDDPHLVRMYSARELLGTLTGRWDPDGIETAGLRPLTTLSYHVLTAAFGESVILHRLFLLALFAVFLVLLGSAAVRVGESPWAVLVAGVLTITAKNSLYHFLWIADGTHVVQAAFAAGSLNMAVRHLDNPAPRRAAWAVVLASLALLTREDSLAMFPVALAVGYVHARSVPEGLSRVRSLALWLAGLTVVFWIWRSTVVPEAPDAADGGVAGVRRIAAMAYWTICLAGRSSDSRWLFIALAALAVATAFTLAARDRNRAWLWLAAAFATTAPGFIEYRANLLIFPIALYALFLGSVLTSVARQRPSFRIPVAALVVLLAILNGRSSRLAQLNLHPWSIDQVSNAWDFVYGRERHATIPRPRLDVLNARLERFGITEAVDFKAWEDAVRRSAGSRPDGNHVFVPPGRFLEP